METIKRMVNIMRNKRVNENMFYEIVYIIGMIFIVLSAILLIATGGLKAILGGLGVGIGVLCMTYAIGA